jgi:hypothetical protein
MKVRVRADDLRLVLQDDTALDLCGLEIAPLRERWAVKMKGGPTWR